MAALLRSQSGLVCPLCEFKTTIIGRGCHVNRSPSMAHGPTASPRYASFQTRMRRPKRMQLSKTVSRPPAHSPPTQRERPSTAPRPRSSPFGGMNRTSVPPVVAAERQRLEARQTRVKEKEEKLKQRGFVASKKSGSKDKSERRAPGVMKALKMQRALSRVGYDHRNSIKDVIADQRSFKDLPLLPSVQQAIESDALKGLIDITPTPIQRLAIPALLGIRDRRGRHIRSRDGGKGAQHFLLAAETGSGKTLAYVIPTLDAIKRAEAAESEQEAQIEAEKQEERRRAGRVFELDPPPLSKGGLNADSGRPRAVVLVPSSGLVDQVGKVFKKFSHVVKVRVGFISAAYTAAVIRSRVFGDAGIDVLVSTPHLLGSLAKSDPNILSRVQHVVVDEADSLFDRSFAPLTTAIIERATPSMKQLILCSATIPRSLDNYLLNNYPDMQRLTTPNLHAIPRRIALSVVEVDKDPYRGNRSLACADYIWRVGLEVEERADSSSSSSSQPTRILVFVNERETAEEVSTFLNSKGIDAVALSRDVSEQRRAELLAPFVEPAPSASSEKEAEEEEREKTLQKHHGGSSSSRSTRRLANTKVLVTTDLGSRGIDTQTLRHVILHDVPHTSIDFIHRLGRIGRMGRRGRAVVLVGKEDRKDVVSEIREAVFRGSALI